VVEVEVTDDESLVVLGVAAYGDDFAQNDEDLLAVFAVVAFEVAEVAAVAVAMRRVSCSCLGFHVSAFATFYGAP
jgi:alkylhydroperoxidase/carboxymuconolactone decarboxylase family protein YurZ